MAQGRACVVYLVMVFLHVSCPTTIIPGHQVLTLQAETTSYVEDLLTGNSKKDPHQLPTQTSSNQMSHLATLASTESSTVTVNETLEAIATSNGTPGITALSNDTVETTSANPSTAEVTTPQAESHSSQPANPPTQLSTAGIHSATVSTLPSSNASTTEFVSNNNFTTDRNESTTEVPKEVNSESTHVSGTGSANVTEHQSPKASVQPGTGKSTGHSTEPGTAGASTISYSQMAQNTSVAENLTATSYQYYTPEIATGVFTEQTTQSIEESTELVTTPSNVKQSTTGESHTTTEQTILNSSEFIRNTTEALGADNEESNDDWKIAVGVIIPTILLIVILVGVYICYRKKYPVRMIIGREFGKFSNPNYAQRNHTPSLIREDADFFFSNNRDSTAVASHEFNPVNRNIMYDNKGFIRDENDEDENERKFLESKKWLFKTTSQDSEKNVQEDVTAESSFIVNSSNGPDSKLDANRNERKMPRNITGTEAVVAEQPMPVAKPRRKKKAPAVPVGKKPFFVPHSQPNGLPATPNRQLDELPATPNLQPNELPATPNHQPDGLPATLNVVSETRPGPPKEIGSSLPRNFGFPRYEERGRLTETSATRQGASNVQAGFSQEVKERSKSLTLERIEFDSRPRSSSVEFPHSARKMSLYDEIVEATRLRFLAAQRAASSISEETNHVTASIVGVDIRDRETSITSSIATDGGGDDDNDAIKSKNKDGDNIALKNPGKSESFSPKVKSNLYSDVANEEPAARDPIFDFSHPQQARAHNQHDVSRFGHDNLGFEHGSENRWHRSLSNKINEAEDIDGIDKLDHVKQENIKAPDGWYSSEVIQREENQDGVDSALPDSYVGVGSEMKQLRVSDTNTPQAFDSSSSSDQDDIIPEFSTATRESKPGMHVTHSSGSDEIGNENGEADSNMIAILKFKEGDERVDHENSSHLNQAGDASDDDDDDTCPIREKREKFKIMPTEMKFSRSSTESEAGSSGSSRGVSSDDEEATNEFPANLKLSRELINEDINTDNNFLVLGTASAVTEPASYLHKADSASRPTQPRVDHNEYSSKAMTEINYSDSSSDSSDILPRRAFNWLPRQPPNMASVASGGESSAPSTAISWDATPRLEEGDGGYDHPEPELILENYNEDGDIDV